MNHLNDAPKSTPDTKKLLAELDVLAEAGALSAHHIEMLALIAQQAAARQTAAPAYVDTPAAAGVVEHVQAIAAIATVQSGPDVALAPAAPASAVAEETLEARADRVIADVLAMLDAGGGGLYIAGHTVARGDRRSFFTMNELTDLEMDKDDTIMTAERKAVFLSYSDVFDVTQERCWDKVSIVGIYTLVERHPNAIIVSWVPLGSKVMIALNTKDVRFGPSE